MARDSLIGDIVARTQERLQLIWVALVAVSDCDAVAHSMYADGLSARIRPRECRRAGRADEQHQNAESHVCGGRAVLLRLARRVARNPLSVCSRNAAEMQN